MQVFCVMVVTLQCDTFGQPTNFIVINFIKSAKKKLKGHSRRSRIVKSIDINIKLLYPSKTLNKIAIQLKLMKNNQSVVENKSEY